MLGSTWRFRLRRLLGILSMLVVSTGLVLSLKACGGSEGSPVAIGPDPQGDPFAVAQNPFAGGVSLVSLTGITYTENFDTLANTETSSTTPPGWFFSETGSNANTTYTAGTGSGNAGDTYSFGASGSTERAFGGLLSGSLIPIIGAEFTNDTGSPITQIDIAYIGEQWRLGTASRSDRIDFQYSLDATSLTTGNWIDVDALDFSTPNQATTGAKDGNAAENRTAVSGSIPSLNIAIGNTFWIRWTDFNASGADDGLAVDDFSMTLNGTGDPGDHDGDPQPPTPECGDPFTPIYDIQGSGDATPLSNQTVTTEGIVIGDYEGAAPNLRGFFIQDPEGDNNPATSDGIFVFNSSNNDVSLGQRIRVVGTAGEFQFQTQISTVTSINICSSDNTVSPVEITLPFPADPFPADPQTDFPERYEGMLVTFNQDLFVTDTFRLGRFGQVTLSSSDRLYQPTNVAAPPATAVQEANERNRIIIDDTQQNQNADPILFPTPNGLSAMNTLRGGDRVQNLTGVMTYTWGGNSSSPNAYRIRPVDPSQSSGNDLATFVTNNPRPTTPPSVGGSLKVVTFNVLNYFNGPTFPTSRGAESQEEFTRQRDKIINAIAAMDGDIVGLIEIQNNGYGSDSAIQDLVNGLNAQMGAGTYAFVDPGTVTLGGDEITNGFIYKPATVEIAPGTTPAALTTGELDQGPNRLHRPPFAVTFRQLSNGAVFTVVNNHLKSKGSLLSCTPTTDPSQGNCNDNRAQAAREILTWLSTSPLPTGTTDPDIMITGDINAYAKEDPIRELETGGYINLITSPTSYSFSFDGFWGSLDHSLANASLNAQVSGAAKWAINADEPPVLDYNTNFKSAGQVSSLYDSSAFRSSDHDPVIVGLNLSSGRPPGPPFTPPGPPPGRPPVRPNPPGRPPGPPFTPPGLNR